MIVSIIIIFSLFIYLNKSEYQIEMAEVKYRPPLNDP